VWAEKRTELEQAFNGDALKVYGPFMRGIAHAALAVLQTSVTAIEAAGISGDINVAAAQLLPVYFLCARNSAMFDMLQRYYMHTVLLCDFHAWQAIEQKLSCVDRDMRSAVKEGLRGVFADPAGEKGVAWEEFQKRFSDMAAVRVALDTSESGGRDGAAGGKQQRMSFFEYIRV